MRILVFFLMVFVPILATAQQKIVDSLHFLLQRHAPIDTTKVRLYCNLAFNYYRINPDSTLIFAQKAHNIATELAYTWGMAESLKNLGIGHYAKGNYQEALGYYKEALQTYQKIGNHKGMASCMNNIGVIHNDYFLNYDKALFYFRQALEQFRILKYEKGLGLLYGNIGESCLLKGEYDTALVYLQKSLVLNKKYKDQTLECLDLYHLSRTLVGKKDYSKAEQYAKEALVLAGKINSNRDVANSLLQLGIIYKTTKRLQESEIKLLAALEISQKIGSKEISKDISYELYDLYEQQQQLAAALKYHKLYDNIKDSIHLVEKDKIIKTLDYDYQIHDKEQQIVLLEKDKQIRQEEKAKERVIIICLLIVITSMLLLGAILFGERQKHIRLNSLLLQKNTEIQQQKEELSLQAQQLGETNQLKDRLFSVIAHDLKSPVNTLKGMLVLLSLDTLSPEDLQMIRQEVNRQLGSIENTLHNLLHWAKSQLSGQALHIEVVEVAELVAENISLLYATALAKDITLTSTVSPNIKVLADYQQLLVIIRNLIANAIKFTPSQGTVTVAAEQQTDSVAITVTDTGVGMTPEQLRNLFGMQTHFSLRGTMGEKGTGLGLLLCKEFVEKNNGTISVESTEGKGSVFTIKLPMAQ
jgi:two-component system sensor histidine kinase/response regulator